MKFSSKLSLSIIISGFVVLLIASFVLYELTYDSLIKSQIKYTKLITAEIAENMEHILNEKIKIALTLSNSPIVINTLESSCFLYENLSNEKRDDFIKSQNEKWKSIKDHTDSFILNYTNNKVSNFLKKQQALLKNEYGEIFLTNKFGALVASTSKLSTFAHAHKYWWKGSYNDGKGKFFLDDRGYDDSVGGYVLGIVVPIKNGKEIIGILKCNINVIGSISKVLSQSEKRISEKSQLVRSGGLVIFEKDIEPLSKRINNSISTKFKEMTSGAVIFADSDEKYLVGFSEIKMTHGTNKVCFGGTFESVDHKKGNTGESWYILCYYKLNEVLKPVNELLKKIAVVSITLIIVLMFVSFIIGKTISKPLKAVSDALQKLGEGTFDYQIKMIKNDEFENVIHSFNSMAEKLQNSTTTIEHLEKEIAEKVLAKKAFKKEKEKSEQYLHMAGVMFIGLDRNGFITLANEKACEILETKEEDIIGKNWFDNFLPEDNNTTIKKVFNQIMETDNLIHEYYENPVISKKGNEKIIAWHNTALYDNDANKIGMLCVGEDRTLRKKLEHEIIQTQKMNAVGTLAGGIAHDFNNILSIILGYSSFGLSMIDEDDRLYKSLSNINNGAIKAKDLTQQLLTFAKGGEPIKKIIAVNNLVKSSADFAISGSNSKCKYEFEPDTWNVEIDEGQMNQVIGNLVINAAQAMPDGGTITLKTENIEILESSLPNLEPGKYVKLCLQDEGTGISEQHLSRIFEPYFSTKQSGSGLGLATTYSIVKKHGGHIKVESIIEKGTRFIIHIPASLKKAVNNEKQIEKKHSGTGRVLIMDDEKMILDMLSVMLKSLGYRTSIVVDGNKAIKMYQKAFQAGDPFDIVILDLTIPGGMGGAKTIPMLKKIDSSAKFVVSSGYSTDPVMANFETYGFSDVMPKPFSKKQLVDLLERLNC
ncbi:response regulator [bacterium]|nr:response regulator [bacterium]